MRTAITVDIVPLSVIPIEVGYESPAIELVRFKQAGVQWSLQDPPNGTATGVVNPATARVFGTMASPRKITRTVGARQTPYVYDAEGIATVAGNPQLWSEITFWSFNQLPNDAVDNGVLEISNTRGYTFLRLVWDITTELNQFAIWTSTLGD